MNVKYAILFYLIVTNSNASEHLPLANVVLIPAGNFLMGCSTNDPERDIDEGVSGGTDVYVPVFKVSLMVLRDIVTNELSF